MRCRRRVVIEKLLVVHLDAAGETLGCDDVARREAVRKDDERRFLAMVD